MYSRPLPLLLALLFNALLSPALMFGLTVLFAAGPLAGPATGPDTGLTLGLLLFGMIPAGGMGPAYTGMLDGNVNLSITISAVSLLLSLGLVPLWSWVLIGKIVQVPVLLILKYLLLIVFLPAVIALLIRRGLMKKFGRPAFEEMKQFLEYFGDRLMMMLLIIPS